MANCDRCSGSCNGCARELTLTPEELMMLEKLAQIPFLPISRRIDDPAPIYTEDAALSQEEYTLVLQLLERKGLITLDFDRPLKNHTGPAAFPIHGSMALTARGQSVIDLIERQGVE